MIRYLLTACCLATPILGTDSIRAANGKEDPAATELLQQARAARVNWSKFPGFRANLSVNDNGKIERGTVVVKSSGSVKVEGFTASVKKRLLRQLRSLVMHRLSGASARKTPCAFADSNKNHPLGRKINVLNDELHSSYRIRARQIIEVNRTMPASRFTITVLKNYQTPDKKFLPASYVVNTWNKSGKLTRSSSHFNIWRRIGSYHLPKSLIVVTASGGSWVTDRAAGAKKAANNSSALNAWSVAFTDHVLLKRD